MMEAGLVLAERRSENNVLLIMAPDADLPLEWLSQMRLIRPREILNELDAEQFIARIDEWLSVASERLQPQLREEPMRLLNVKEYRAAVISAVALLENRLRNEISFQTGLTSSVSEFAPIHAPLSQLLKVAERRQLLSRQEGDALRHAVQLRNAAVHKAATVSSAEARRSVNAVLAFLARLDRNEPTEG
jgi:hypothetical protein